MKREPLQPGRRSVCVCAICVVVWLARDNHTSCVRDMGDEPGECEREGEKDPWHEACIDCVTEDVRRGWIIQFYRNWILFFVIAYSAEWT